MTKFKNKNSRVDISAEKLNLKPFRTFLGYVKPYTFQMFISLLLIAVITVIELLNPLMIMVAIDDIVQKDDIHIGIYEGYGDFTGVKYGDKFYSTVTHNYRKPKSVTRMVRINDTYFFVNEDMKIDKKTLLVYSDDKYYVMVDGRPVFINKADDNFVNAIITANKHNLYSIFIIFALLLILLFLLQYLSAIIRNIVGQRIIYDLRVKIFNHIMKMDIAYFERNPIGRLVTRTTNDVKNIHTMYTGVLLNGIKDLALVIGIVIMMFYLNVKLAIVSILLLPIHIFSLFLYRTFLLKLQRNIKLKVAEINSKLSEYISGMKLIQLYTAEKEYSEDFITTNIEYKRVEKKRVRLYSFFSGFLPFIMGVTPLVILFYATPKVIEGTLEIGLVVAFIRYTYSYFKPLNMFSSRFSILQSAMASMERIIIILKTEPEILNKENGDEFRQLEKNIEFKNVSFSYNKKQSSTDVLRDVSIRIEKGKTIALVGHTGSGKSTIISLINRFYEVENGKITFDGKDIKNFDIFSLRKKIAVVLQDTFLFSDTILENIRLYDESITLEDVKEAARIVNADKLIEKLEGGYNYVLKEDGKELSEGERQLISFARAIVYKPTLLILDEATSSIDSETEALIQDAIEKLKANFTLLVIAHRLSTINTADKIVVLKNGKVIETGKHDDLMKIKNGLYQKLYRLDFAD